MKRPTSGIAYLLEQKERILSHAAYGRSAAVQVSAQRSRSEVPTVGIETAPRQDGQCDWSNKLSQQLSKSELPLWCAVLLGTRASAQFTHRGAERNKSLRFDRTDQGLKITASGPSSHHVVFVGLGDLFWFATIALRQLSDVHRDNPMLLDMALKALDEGRACDTQPTP